MVVKVTEYSEPRADTVLIGMVVHTQVLVQLVPFWENGARFGSPAHDLAGELAVDYFRRHHRAPGKDILPEALIWAEQHPGREEEYRLLEKVLARNSETYERHAEEINPQYVLSLAGDMFNKLAFRKFLNDAETDLDTGHFRKALERLTKFRTVEIGTESRGRLLNDSAELHYAYLEPPEPLVEYPGALGEFFADVLARDVLFAFMAPEKTGKTFWLLDLAMRSVEQRRRTVFFGCGDMSKRQMYWRFISRIAERPFRSPNRNWPCSIAYPISLEAPPGEDEPALVTHEQREFTGPLTEAIAQKAIDRFVRRKLKSLEDYLSIQAFPAHTMSVAGIRSLLQRWDQEGFTPDTIVIDYADILAPLPGTGRYDPRDQTNRTWEALRALSTERCCLVATATQANAKSYNQRGPLGRWNFSEDKRKLANASAVAGINVSPDQKDRGLMGLNWVALREGEFNTNKICHVASCLPLANPAVISTW